MNASMQSTDIYYVTPERIALHKRDFDRASEARSDRSKKQEGQAQEQQGAGGGGQPRQKKELKKEQKTLF